MVNATRHVVRWFVGIALAVTLVGCTTNKITPPDAAPDAAMGTPVATIGDNHSHAPHMMMMAAADVTAGADKTYSIMGSSNHDHMVTVTVAQFMMIMQNQAIAVLSTAGGLDAHTHCVTIGLAGATGTPSC